VIAHSHYFGKKTTTVASLPKGKGNDSSVSSDPVQSIEEKQQDFESLSRADRRNSGMQKLLGIERKKRCFLKDIKAIT
jgi:hypothetical protein